MKPTKNKKRNNPRYHLNEAYGMPPAGDISAFGSYPEVPEESGMSGPKEISQSAYKSASNSGLMKPTVEDEEMLSAVFPQKEIIDLKKIRDKTKLPIVAIGGVNQKNYKKLLNSGANYIAISSFIWNNPILNPSDAIKRIK